jgi:arginyl-tRNA synthetase
MHTQNEIKKSIKRALKFLGFKDQEFSVEHPADLAHGDYSTNVALIVAREADASAGEIADKIIKKVDKDFPKEVESVEIAGGGFINFYLSKDFFKKSLGEIIEKGEAFGKNSTLAEEKVMVEHTDPNPFKNLHIGHLMPMTIGSAIARILEWNGAEVKQVCYQGDVGIHVAKAVWAMLRGEGDPYIVGAKAYEESEEAKKEITEINKKIYERSDEAINKLYDAGRSESLEKFDALYQTLGVKFDYLLFESETAEFGKKIVEENVGKVFEKGEGGAVIFKGEASDPSLHTRVFVNSEGLPTYEAKELGLAKIKFEKYPYTHSIVVTGNEIRDYFRVVLAAMALIYPDLAKKTTHLSHGMLRLPTGKMSSRTGDVITAETLIEEVKKKVKDNEPVAIGAVKYMVLRQAIGRDIIFDIEKSVSTEGDSGVYLQYAYARAHSLLEKAGNLPAGRQVKGNADAPRENLHEIEKLLYRFPEVVERAGTEFAPHHLATYLTELVSSFNNFYAHEQVIPPAPDHSGGRAGGESSESAYRLAVVQAFAIVIKNGLTILGIPTPERM